MQMVPSIDAAGIIVFSETWLQEGQDAPDIVGFTVHNYPRPDRFQRGRHTQGGIAVYIRDSVSASVSVFCVGPQNCYVGLRLRHVFAGHAESFLFACYIPPRTTANRFELEPVWPALTQDVQAVRVQGPTFIVGDLNARTGTSPDWPASMVQPGMSVDTFSTTVMPTCATRHSQDSSVNHHGDSMLRLCRVSDLRIANGGRVPGDAAGALTYVNPTPPSGSAPGSYCSVLDYVVASPDAMALVHDLRVVPAPPSDHLALHVRIQSVVGQQQQQPEQPTAPVAAEEALVQPQMPRMSGTKTIEKWAESLFVPAYADALATLTAAVQAQPATPETLTAYAVAFDSIVYRSWAAASAADASPGRRQHAPQRNGSGEELPRWWDAELGRARRAARRAMRRDPTSHVARSLVRAYESDLRRKMGKFSRAQAVALATMARDQPARFWRRFKPRKQTCAVSAGRLFQHFSTLLGQPPPRVSAQPPDTAAWAQGQPPSADGAELNKEFTVSDVLAGIACLKRSRSTVGLLTLEALSAAAPSLTACVTALLNACAQAGTLPQSWTLCAVTPIHKGGDVTDPSNYRGIAVGSLLSKLYATLLDSRLSAWAERHGLRASGQAGFRKTYRTSDQVLLLRTLIERARCDSLPLYVCFVDFKKAYDTVPRDLLWQKLQRLGVSGWFLSAVQALYAEVPMAVKVNGGVTSVFHSLQGLKQGCPLSPLLFGLFIDDFQTVVLANAAALDLPTLAGRPMPPPFYADDCALVSTSCSGAQKQLDLLKVYCGQWGLTVNVAKTKAVDFSAPTVGHPSPQLTYESAEIETLRSFCYLGMELHDSGSFAQAGQARKESGERAAHMIAGRCRELHITQPLHQLALFDAVVRPSVLYGAEVWAPGLLCQASRDLQAEVLHRHFCRRVLGVRAGTTSMAVLAELGRYPLHLSVARQLCRYWNRLVGMDDGRLVKQAFLESLALARRSAAASRRTWAGQVASFLAFTAPVTAEGTAQRVDADAVEAYLQRAYLQKAAGLGSKMQDYLNIVGPLSSDAYTPAAYLQAVSSPLNRRRLAQLRTQSHNLGVETGRWNNVPRDRRTCARCSSGEVDDVQHMTLECAALAEQRIAHASLFAIEAGSLQQFFEQDPTELAAFCRECHAVCVEQPMGEGEAQDLEEFDM